MSDIVIKAENLSKRYRIGAAQEPYGSLRESLARAVRKPFRRRDPDETIWALKDVSFEIKRGEVVGIIGRNGAGKSTLLKILSRITKPTSGQVTLRGRVGSLLEVGTGFHPELTGRENIYLNGAILGMGRHEIERKFDEIVDFAEIEKFLDTPVKRYSSGMYVRLAFAVAAHLEPEILLVDEVLAVGDAAFQKKCLGKMGEVAEGGRTVLFVSHNLSAVLSLCRFALIIEKGELYTSGGTQQVVDAYQRILLSTAKNPLSERVDRYGDGKARLTSLKVEPIDGGDVIRITDRLRIQIEYASTDEVLRPAFLIGIFDQLSRRIYFLDSRDVGGIPEKIPSKGVIHCETGPINIPSGQCSMNVAMIIGNSISDHVVAATIFDVFPTDFFGTGRLPDVTLSVGLIRHQWELIKN